MLKVHALVLVSSPTPFWEPECARRNRDKQSPPRPTWPLVCAACLASVSAGYHQPCNEDVKMLLGVDHGFEEYAARHLHVGLHELGANSQQVHRLVVVQEPLVCIIIGPMWLPTTFGEGCGPYQ